MYASTICLNMIVKNETPVLGRLLQSVKDVIDYYVIIDTGSTDGTPEFIKKQMAHYGISGEIISEPWVNFGVNRNLALEHACQRRRDGWLLLIDADEELAGVDAGFHHHLQPGVTYCLKKHHADIRYSLPNLIDISQNSWRWRGVVHEYLEHRAGPDQRRHLETPWIIYHAGEGVRSRGLSDEQKFLRDAALLEDELKTNPEDAPSQFYLAQSYRDAGHTEQAYRHYLKRANMPGWAEETFFAQLQAAQLAAQLNYPYALVVEAYHKAFELRPARAESLHGLAAYCRQQQHYHLAYLFAETGLRIPMPDDILFVNPDVYRWKLLDELAVAAYWTGRFDQSKTANEALLQKHQAGEIQLTEADHKRIHGNLQFALGQLMS